MSPETIIVDPHDPEEMATLRRRLEELPEGTTADVRYVTRHVRSADGKSWVLPPPPTQR